MKSIRGFTLIEIILVVGIIAVIVAVILPNFIGTREDARDKRRTADVQQVKLALELYYDANNAYPVAADPGASVSTLAATLLSYVEVPSDPIQTGSDDYQYISDDGQGYSIRIKYEDVTIPGTDANGYCQTGVNVDSSWFSSAPLCLEI